MAEALHKTGCEVEDAILRNKALEMFNKTTYGVNSLEEIILSSDLEGYYIGQIATLLLRFEFKKSDWQDSIKKGESPLEILLKNIIPETDNDDVHLKDRIERLSKKKDKEIGNYLDEDIQFLTNTDYIRINIPYSWLQSNLMPRFFVSPNFNDTRKASIRVMIPLGTEHRFISHDKKSYLNLSQDTVIFFEDNTYTSSMTVCGIVKEVYTTLTLVHKDHITHHHNKDGEYIEIHQKNVKGKVFGKFLNDDVYGFNFFCPLTSP